MKKKYNLCLLALVIGFAFLLQNCQEEDSTILEENVISTELSSKNDKDKDKDKDKVTVCHYDAATNTWGSKLVQPNALPSFLLNGDVLIDEDGDGFAVFNECGILNSEGIDCDDTNSAIHPNAEEICGDGIDNNCDKIDDCLTFVPDDNFENYLETHNYNGDIVDIGDNNSMGNGINNDNYVLTSNINTITSLNVSNKGISDLTGIEDFIALTSLHCSYNALTSLDVSGLTALTYLRCSNNYLTSLDVSGATALTTLLCQENQLRSLDVSGATALTTLDCYNNQLTSLDVSGMTALTTLYCSNNADLICIQLNQTQMNNHQDTNYGNPYYFIKDAGAVWSLNCY